MAAGSVKDRLLRGMKIADSGCWEWQKCEGSLGYGSIFIKDSMRGAHRVSYEIFVGDIPSGLKIDHLCRNTKCINPAHLEAVTHRENVLRGIGPTAFNAKKTHCDLGHEFTLENILYDHKNNRRCRICYRKYQNKYQIEWKKRLRAKKRLERDSK